MSLLLAPAIANTVLGYSPGGLPGGNQGRVLIAPGHLAFTVTRAQISGVRSTARAADDVTWQEYAADTPRFDGATRRALIEGQQTNAISNPRGEGAVAGTPGTLPTGVSAASSGGLSREILGRFNVGGVDVVRVRYFGTATGNDLVWQFTPDTGIVAAPNQTWVAQAFIRLVEAPAPPASARFRIVGRTAAGSGVSGNSFLTTAINLLPALVRQTASVTLTSDVNLARITLAFNINLSTGAFHDFTLDIGWPDFKQQTFLTSPILPAPAVIGASTRGADLVTTSLASLRIADNGACTVLFTAVVPTEASTAQTFLTLDDGTANNRLRLFIAAGGLSLSVGRTLAGADASNTVASVLADTLFTAGVTINGTGRIAGVLGGGSVAQELGGPISGLTTMRLGSNASGIENLFGRIGRLFILPYAIPDAELQARVARLPLN